jgi:hypothetical protein
MRLRRGCGCPIFILGLANLVYLVSGMVALVQHKTTVWGALFVMLVALGDLIVCVVVGLAAIRKQPLTGLPSGAEGEDADWEEGHAGGEQPPTDEGLE